MKGTRPPKHKQRGAKPGIRLVTASYAALNRMSAEEWARYAAIRTSRGAPRFPLRYNMAGTAGALMPPRHLLGVDDAEEYADAYRLHLEQQGAHYIRTELAAISGDAGGRPLALLCFCNLERGQFCHRRIFAEWWEEKTGEAVPEVSPPSA